MKVLITGATGFIGAAVTRAVVAKGDEVRVLVRPTSDLKNLEGVQVETVQGDLQDPPSLKKAIAGCQGLYHVAAHYALWDQDPSTFYAINVEGTKNLLGAAVEAGVQRIVYTSTVGAIGLPDQGGLGNEALFPTLAQLSGDYKRSKFLAEQEVLRMAQQGLPVVIVNPTAPVGARDVKPTPTGQIIVDFLRGRMLAYIETGMNLVDVEDIAIGHVRAMERGRVGERYILGNQNLTLKEIFQILSRLTGVPAPRLRLPWRLVLPLAHANQWIANLVTHSLPRIPLEGVRMAKYHMHYDCKKARQELALPQNPVETALKKSVEWFRQYGYA
ncbi:MAG: NAD-dependent epimerase/dehydratase family protein [Nitrospirota bacterium]|nr:NAD-dependent epimerase/dehydratase family protein [Nitrospirota bacterium]MDH5698333.1 NAD-dependent epimerase/dehydratase family protein [Nitrospirota bacterium]